MRIQRYYISSKRTNFHKIVHAPKYNLMTLNKKTPRANLERRRHALFLMALVLVLSLLYTALEWNVQVFQDRSSATLDDIIEDLDLDLLKKDFDMVAALSEIEIKEETGNIVVTVDIEQPEELLTSIDEENSGMGENNSETEKIQDAEEQLVLATLNDHEKLIIMEKLPEFPGGASAFMKWLTTNIKYPPSAQQKKISGQVLVSFIIDTEGNPTDITLVSASNPTLGSLVMSVLNRMPKWEPGVQEGHICSTMVKLPINFEL